MWGTVLCSFAAGVALVWSLEDGKIVRGRWYVNSMQPCPNAEKYPYELTARKTKLNRTHDLFNAQLNFGDEITGQSHAAYIEFCKKTDGGCKLQYTLTPSSVCDFSREFGGANFPAILKNMGLEHGDCPIPKADLKLTDYLFDYNGIPERATEGEYTATAILIKGNVQVMCIMLDVSFTEIEEDECEDDK